MPTPPVDVAPGHHADVSPPLHLSTSPPLHLSTSPPSQQLGGADGPAHPLVVVRQVMPRNVFRQGNVASFEHPTDMSGGFWGVLGVLILLGLVSTGVLVMVHDWEDRSSRARAAAVLFFVARALAGLVQELSFECIGDGVGELRSAARGFIGRLLRS